MSIQYNRILSVCNFSCLLRSLNMPSCNMLTTKSNRLIFFLCTLCYMAHAGSRSESPFTQLAAVRALGFHARESITYTLVQRPRNTSRKNLHAFWTRGCKCPLLFQRHMSPPSLSSWELVCQKISSQTTSSQWQSWQIQTLQCVSLASTTILVPQSMHIVDHATVWALCWCCSSQKAGTSAELVFLYCGQLVANKPLKCIPTGPHF